MFSTLIKNCNIEGFNSSMDLVKNASIFSKDGIIYIKHYSTIIFAYDSKNNVCECDFDCSMTSNKQINYALNHFDIDRKMVINTHQGEKWSHRGTLN